MLRILRVVDSFTAYYKETGCSGILADRGKKRLIAAGKDHINPKGKWLSSS